MSEIQYSNSITSSNNPIGTNDNTFIKQDLNVSGFETFQRKVASKSLCKRAVGVITGVFGGAGAAVGGIFAIKIGVAAMVGALAGLVGAAAAPFVLIGMGALCIAAIIGGVVLFVKNRKENIYIKELNKLLQSDGVKDKIKNRRQAISYLNEMISKHKEGSVEHNATVRFLNENTEIFKLCLKLKDHELVDGITKFLTEASKNKCGETEYAIKSIIVDCLNSTDNTKNDNATKILTEMLKNKDIKSIAEGIIKGHIKSDNTRSMANTIKLLTALLKDKSAQTTVVQIVETCLDEKDLKLRSNAIKLLTEMLKNNDTRTYAETIIKNYSGKIGEWLESGNNELKANTIMLLTEMLKSKSTDLAEITKKIIIDKDFIIKGQSFADIIKGWLRSGDDGLKIKTVELLNEMLVDSDDGRKNKSREILKSDVLNTKDMLNIFLKKRRRC